MRRELEGAKPGDKIKVRPGFGAQFEVHIVEKVTKTRVVCSRASFMIDSGLQIGTGNFSRGGRYGSFATEQDFNAAALERRLYEAKSLVAKIRVTEENLAIVERFIKEIFEVAEKEEK